MVEGDGKFIQCHSRLVDSCAKKTVDEWQTVRLDVCEEEVRRSLRVAIFVRVKVFKR